MVNTAEVSGRVNPRNELATLSTLSKNADDMIFRIFLPGSPWVMGRVCVCIRVCVVLYAEKFLPSTANIYLMLFEQAAR